MTPTRTIIAIIVMTGVLSASVTRAQGTLGLSIDPTSGVRGTTVAGQVNPADIAANCNTTPEQLQAAFAPLLERLSTDPALCELIFPGLGDCSPLNIPNPTNYTQLSYFYLVLAAFAVTEDFSGATAAALPQTFVMLFADVATQAPLGPTGNFDPVTGVGSVVVPDIAAGQYPVAAACVVPDPSVDRVLGAIQLGSQTLQLEAVPLPDADPTFDYLSSVFELGPRMIVPLMVPKAIGLQLFTIANPVLGFTIDPTEGLPGDTVNGQVNPADVAAHCNTTTASVSAAFDAVQTAMGLDKELCDRFWPGAFQEGVCNFTFDPTNYEQLSYIYLTLASFGIAFDLSGAAEQFLEQSFVMTFADLGQNPIGERGTFDPVTGIGSVVVPSLDPGFWPVAATCVTPRLELIGSAVEAGAQILQDMGIPMPLPPGYDLFGTAPDIGPALIPALVSPRALGVQVFKILADVDHFQCYRARNSRFSSREVTLSDRFGTRTVTVRSPRDLCAPADTNGEDPEAIESPDFLTTYRLNAAPQQSSRVEAENQFGAISLSVRAPRLLMVPTAVSETTPPASPDGAFLNHFTCYDVRVADTASAPTAPSVTVQTAFETVQVQPTKPKRLCVPTSKNGEPVIDSRPENLLCYVGKSRQPSPAPAVFIANQFGSQLQRLGQRKEICIPTTLLPST